MKPAKNTEPNVKLIELNKVSLKKDEVNSRSPVGSSLSSQENEINMLFQAGLAISLIKKKSRAIVDPASLFHGVHQPCFG